MSTTGTTVRDFDGTFPECQARVHICDYACCKFGPMGNWIATYPGEVEKAKELGLGFGHLMLVPQTTFVQSKEGDDNPALKIEVISNTCSVTCRRPCVEGEFKSIDCAIYPLFPANDDASLFIVADHRKCPIPNSQLMGWAIKVRRLLEEIEAETPGIIANMAKNGQGFKGYQAFPYRVWGSMALPLRKFEVHTLFQHYVFEDVTCKYAVGDTIKSLYTATNTPEDAGYSLPEIVINPTSENG